VLIVDELMTSRNGWPEIHVSRCAARRPVHYEAVGQTNETRDAAFNHNIQAPSCAPGLTSIQKWTDNLVRHLARAAGQENRTSSSPKTDAPNSRMIA